MGIGYAGLWNAFKRLVVAASPDERRPCSAVRQDRPIALMDDIDFSEA